MKQGNTILNQIKTGYDLRDANKVEIAFGQKGKIILVKTGDDVIVNEDDVRFVLTKEELALFEPGRYIPIDITAYYDEGTQITSNVMYRPFDGTVQSTMQKGD